MGRTIELGTEPFIVVGVIEKSDSFQPVINSYKDYMTYYQETAGMILIPEASWPILYTYDEPEQAVVTAERVEDMSEVGRKTGKTIMNEAVIGALRSRRVRPTFWKERCGTDPPVEIRQDFLTGRLIFWKRPRACRR